MPDTNVHLNERVEHTWGGHNKYWEVMVVGTTAYVQWGKIGTLGQTQQKEFSTVRLAVRFGEEKLAEKVGKGYTRVGRARTLGFPSEAEGLRAAEAAIQRTEAREAAKPRRVVTSIPVPPPPPTTGTNRADFLEL